MQQRRIFILLCLISLCTAFCLMRLIIHETSTSNQFASRYQVVRPFLAPRHLFVAKSFVTSPPVPCEPEVNVAYIKTHKTASTTLQTIFNRFGFFKNLSFIFNRNSPYNGHFNDLVVNKSSSKKIFLPPLGVRDGDLGNYTNYNMIAVHVRYFRDALRYFMANGTRFVTIIREPAAQWESAFNHFEFRRAIAKAAGKKNLISLNKTHNVQFDKTNTSEDAIQEFLREPEFYHNSLKSEQFQGMKEILWHYAKNNQMFDLGLETELHDNETLVNEAIDRLESELDMVVINEYFDESLVVMKKMFCWTFEDILYLSKNRRPGRTNLTEETLIKIREWNRADVLLYDRFNSTLWRKINEYGSTFDQDLREFRLLLNETHTNCSVESKVISWGKNHFQHTEFVPKANSSLLCQTIAESKAALFARIFHRQKPPTTSKPKKRQIPPKKGRW